MGVNIQESPETVRAFLRERKATYPNVLDQDAAVARKFAIRGIPAIILVDKAGKIRYQGYKLPERSVIDKVL